MKKLSIRCKITGWFAIALLLVVALTYFVILAVSNQVIQKTIRDNLIHTVKNNVDEVEYFPTIEAAALTSDVDFFLPYKNGFLEVDDDFLDEVNEIYTTLYDSGGAFLYGENPIAEETTGLKFADSQIQTLAVKDTLYYIFDSKLTAAGLDGLWMRGVVSERQGAVQMASIARTSLILMPSFVILAILGGYLIAGRMLRPIKKISEAAGSIREGGDLKKRIELGKGKDELHQLADNFNLMFDRLEAAFQTERQFTSDASHELRTPMAVIMAQCELALEQRCSDAEYEEALTVIQRQGQKMSRLIGDLLDFTRLERKSEQYAINALNLTQLVSAVCADMALIEKNGITLRYELAPDIECKGNPELLARLLTNLISNAYQYGKANGAIFVSLQRSPEALRLCVQDNGIGIAEEEQEKIFHRFYQANASYSGEGTGLGLSMVLEIAKFHGGSISVDSRMGEGSTFTLTLPE